MSRGKLIKGKFVRALTCDQGCKLSAPAWGEIVWDCGGTYDDSDVKFFLFEEADRENVDGLPIIDNSDTYRVYSLENLPDKVAAAYAAWRMTNG